jgi:hypothetical protein
MHLFVFFSEFFKSLKSATLCNKLKWVVGSSKLLAVCLVPKLVTNTFALTVTDFVMFFATKWDLSQFHGFVNLGDIRSFSSVFQSSWYKAVSPSNQLKTVKLR